MHPTARTDKLTVQELADETLVFDHETGKAHCLNRVAGDVWRHCDGTADPAEIAARLDLPRAAVSLALEQLERRQLLLPGSSPLPARRDALRKLAAAAVLLPAIMTITAPQALAQASPACTNDGQCSSLTNACQQGQCLNGNCVAVSNCTTGLVCCTGALNSTCATPQLPGSNCLDDCECQSGSCNLAINRCN